MKKLFFILFFFISIIFFTPAFADRGFVPPADISVYGPGQKAIIAWNGSEEILILSTDLWTTENVTILQFIPLPSQPSKVEKANFSSFEIIVDLIWEKMPRVPKMPWVRELVPPVGIEIVFREKIGSHDITIVKVNDLQEFVIWTQDFLVEKGLEGNVFSTKLASVLGEYFENDMRYFVFDLIEIGPTQRSIEPIYFQFESNFLYYPLIVSSLASGETEIDLFALTPNKLTASDIGGTKLSIGKYADGTPIQFKLNSNELRNIDPRIGKLLSSAWLTALKYEGPVESLDKDLIVQLKFPIDPEAGVFIVILLIGLIAIAYLFSILTFMRGKAKKRSKR